MYSNANQRRRSLITGATVAAGLALSNTPIRAEQPFRIKAVAFDGFTTFNPQNVADACERAFPGKGAALINSWRTRQFEYTWLRTLMNRYENFWTVTRDSLVWAAKALTLELTEDKEQELLQAVLEVSAWPDAASALRDLKDAGIRLAFLANLTPHMLDRWVDNAKLNGIFENHLSTDRVRQFKPHPSAYKMGVDHFRLKRGEIVFAAFGGWDAAGAKSFGYPTFWVNRANTPVEELGLHPDGMGKTLHDLRNFVLSSHN